MKWKIERLGELARIERGRFSHRPRNDPCFYGGDIPFIQTGDVSGAKLGIIHYYTQTLNEKGLSVSKVFPRGTLLVSIAANIGDSAILGFDSACPDSVIAVTPHDQLDTVFLRYYMAGQQRWLTYLAPAGAQKNINVEFLDDLEIEHPPLPEQRKIADILGAWDEALEKLDALIAAKDRRKQALMQQLLTGNLRMPGFSIPWHRVRFGDLMRTEDRYADFDDGTLYNLVSVRRRAEGVFFREALHGREIKTKTLKRVHTGDFLISRMQVVHGALGRVSEDYDGFFASDSYEVLVPREKGRIDVRFLEHLSRRREFWQLALVCSHGVHIEKMTFVLDDFMDEKIQIPATTAEQRAIADILDAADTELRLLRNQRAAIDQQKRGLMQRLLTGKVRVRL